MVKGICISDGEAFRRRGSGSESRHKEKKNLSKIPNRFSRPGQEITSEWDIHFQYSRVEKNHDRADFNY